MSIITITNSSVGASEDVSAATSGFSVAVTTQGVDLVEDSIEVVGTGQMKIKLSNDETKILKAELRSLMHIAVDFPLPEGRKIYKIIDAYDVCESKFSLD